MISKERQLERLDELTRLRAEYDRAKALIESPEYAAMRLKCLERIESIVRGVMTPDTHALILGRILEVLDNAGLPARTVKQFESLKREYNRAADSASSS